LLMAVSCGGSSSGGGEGNPWSNGFIVDTVTISANMTADSPAVSEVYKYHYIETIEDYQTNDFTASEYELLSSDAKNEIEQILQNNNMIVYERIDSEAGGTTVIQDIQYLFDNNWIPISQFGGESMYNAQGSLVSFVNGSSIYETVPASIDLIATYSSSGEIEGYEISVDSIPFNDDGDSISTRIEASFLRENESRLFETIIESVSDNTGEELEVFESRKEYRFDDDGLGLLIFYRDENDVLIDSLGLVSSTLINDEGLLINSEERDAGLFNFITRAKPINEDSIRARVTTEIEYVATEKPIINLMNWYEDNVYFIDIFERTGFLIPESSWIFRLLR